MRRTRLIKLLLLLLATGFAGSLQATDWTQFGYDQAHSGFNAAEPGYSTATGNVVVPAFAGGIALTHQTDSAPIFLGGVATASGTKDLIFINALDGTLTAKDASTGTTVWSQQPPVAPGSDFVLAHGGSNGSPAIDPAHQYVFHYGLDGKIHKYQVGDGTEIVTGGWPQVATAKPDQEKGASSVAIATTPSGTFLYYVNDGYDGDGGDYQGHLTTINLATGAQKVFNSLCSNVSVHLTKSGGANPCNRAQSGIWGRPGAVYSPATNRVYISTGNGPNDPANFRWGDSVLALNADGSGSAEGYPIDAYIPTTTDLLNSSDADLGDTSIVILPTPAGSTVANVGIQGGKDGCVRLLNLGLLNGQYDQLNSTTKPPIRGGELQAFDLPGVAGGAQTYCQLGNANSGQNRSTFKPQPAVWVNPADGAIWIYVAHNNGLASYTLGLDGSNKPTLTAHWTSASSGTSPVVANGTVYYIAGSRVVALNATTGASIWSGPSMGGIHWQSPILVNGHVYAIDNTSKLWAFQLDGIFKNGLQ